MVGQVVCMRVNVDEPRRDGESARIDDPPGGSSVDLADYRDAAILDGDVSDTGGRAGSVDHTTPNDRQIVGRRDLP